MFLCLLLPVLRHRRVTPSNRRFQMELTERGRRKLPPSPRRLNVLGSDQSATAANDYSRSSAIRAVTFDPQATGLYLTPL